jgi:hypothetical protein
MPKLFRYRCTTETISAGEPIDVFEEREISEGVPTVCVTDPGHVIIVDSITLISETDPSIEANTQVINSLTQGNQLISGTAAWSSLLIFDVSIIEYIIEGNFYTAVADQITLTPADGSFDRIDIIYADVGGLIGFVTGAASAAPVEPTIDELTQIKITSVTIPAGSTTPNITTEDIYLEGVGSGGGLEWDITETSPSGTFDLSYVTDPFEGTNSIQALAVNTGDYISATPASDFDMTDTNVLEINIKSTAAWFETMQLLILCYYNGAPNGNNVILKNGSFGFDSTSVAWQSLSIAKQLFNLSNKLVDELRITVNGVGDPLTFQLDRIRWQQGIAAEVLEEIIYDVENVGIAGTGVFARKTGNTFEFKKLNVGSTSVTLTDDIANDEIKIDVDLGVLEAAVDHNVLTNYEITQHRIINDAGTSATELWSASKIDTELTGKSATGHTHTASEVTDFSAAADARITLQKAAINGLATLDGSGKVPTSQIPSLAITGVDVVADIPTRDALTPGIGDVAKVTNSDGFGRPQTYIWSGSVWVDIQETSDVMSVNAATGVIVLDTDDIAEGSANLYYTETRVDDHPDVNRNTTYLNSILRSSQLLSGSISWVGPAPSLTFEATPLEYSIDGMFYTSGGGQTTLTTAHGTFDRIDCLFVDIGGVIGKADGTPAGIPLAPEIDTSSRLKIGSVLVEALSSSPSITVTDIYLENVGTGSGEWDAISNSGNIVVNSANNPFAGSISIEGVSAINGDRVDICPVGTFDMSTVEALVFELRSTTAWPINKRIQICFLNGGILNGDWILISDGYRGFDEDGSAYTLITIAKHEFLLESNTVDTLRFQVVGGGAAITSFNIDNVQFQGGLGLELNELLNHINDKNNPHDVTKSQIGLGNVENVLNNYTAITTPTINDDSGDGYTIGSTWVNTSTGSTFILTDPTITAAVWIDITSGSSANATQLQDFPISETDPTNDQSLVYNSTAGVWEPNGEFKSHIDDSTIHFTENSIDHTSIVNVGTNTHAQLDTHVGDLTLHRLINDAGTSTIDLWSANKLTTELNLKETASNKNIANGYAGLDSGGIIPNTLLPPLSITKPTLYSNLIDRDADVGNVQEGDVAIVTDVQKSYIYDGSGYIELITTGSISSVNGLSGGSIVLTTADVAEVTNLYYTEARVSANIDLVNSVGSIGALETWYESESNEICTEVVPSAITEITSTSGGTSFTPSTGTYRVTFNGQFELTQGNSLVSQAPAAINSLKDQLNALTYAGHVALYGNGEILTAGNYYIAGATTQEGVLEFDAEGDPDATFVIKCGAAHAMNIGSSTVLSNLAKASNVLYYVVGALSAGTNVPIVGTFVCDAAIDIAVGCSLNGRLFTTLGAITTGNIMALPTDDTFGFNLGVSSQFVLFSINGDISNPSPTTNPPIINSGLIACGAGTVLGFGIFDGTYTLGSTGPPVIVRIVFGIYDGEVLSPSSLTYIENIIESEYYTVSMATTIISTGDPISARIGVDTTAGSAIVTNRTLFARKLS